MTGIGALTLLDTPRYVLGEGPAWDAASSRVSWIDIEEGLVLSAEYRHGALGPITTLHLGGVVGCALPISGGRHLVALEAWIGILHSDGRLEKSRALLPTGARFNDGKIDPQGRLVVGSLHRTRVDDHQVLVRLELDGSVTTLDDDLHQSNGLAWSPDGTVMYSSDTAIGRIYQRPYGNGEAGTRSVFADLDGMPDGLTVDTDGNLWITIFNGGRVDCYSPDGTRVSDRTIHVPDHHPASVEFIGADLDELVLTTGFPRLEDPEAMALQSPRDGELFIADVGARGVASTPWREVDLPG